MEHTYNLLTPVTARLVILGHLAEIGILGEVTIDYGMTEDFHTTIIFNIKTPVKQCRITITEYEDTGCVIRSSLREALRENKEDIF